MLKPDFQLPKTIADESSFGNGAGSGSTGGSGAGGGGGSGDDNEDAEQPERNPRQVDSLIMPQLWQKLSCG